MFLPECNKMYTLTTAKEHNLDQITQLICNTGYFVAMAKYNILGLPYVLFIRDYIAKPLLRYTTIIIDQDGDNIVLAMIICAAKKELMPSTRYGDYLHPQITEMFDLHNKFELPDSYRIGMMAVTKSARKRGLGRKLLEYAETKAKESGYDNLSLSVWSCQTDAIKLYLDIGMMITKIINRPDNLPCSTLLYLEKNPVMVALKNYFETEAYNTLNLLDKK